MSTPSGKDLKHYGVKGMKWGVHRDTIASIAKNAAPVAKAGLDALGKRYTPDATKSQFSQRVSEAGGLHRVSDKELQTMLNRMNMEQNYNRFMQQENERRAAGKKSAFKFLFEAGKLVVPLVVGGPVAAATSPGAFKAYSTVANSVLERGGTLED
jgi:hypothetical protein